jgi:hypothetical protein
MGMFAFERARRLEKEKTAKKAALRPPRKRVTKNEQRLTEKRK